MKEPTGRYRGEKTVTVPEESRVIRGGMCWSRATCPQACNTLAEGRGLQLSLPCFFCQIDAIISLENIQQYFMSKLILQKTG